MQTSDLALATQDLRPLLAHLTALLDRHHDLPALVVAQALVDVDRVRSQLHVICGRVEDATRSKT